MVTGIGLVSLVHSSGEAGDFARGQFRLDSFGRYPVVIIEERETGSDTRYRRPNGGSYSRRSRWLRWLKLPFALLTITSGTTSLPTPW